MIYGIFLNALSCSPALMKNMKCLQTFKWRSIGNFQSAETIAEKLKFHSFNLISHILLALAEVRLTIRMLIYSVSLSKNKSTYRYGRLNCNVIYKSRTCSWIHSCSCNNIPINRSQQFEFNKKYLNLSPPLTEFSIIYGVCTWKSEDPSLNF